LSEQRVECVIPILRVKSLQRSLEFYQSVLGFGLEWETATLAAVSRDGRQLMFCEGDQGQPGTWVWIGVTDIRPLAQRLKEAGVSLLMEPTSFHWAYEMRVQDPDGHVLRFGSDPSQEDDTPQG
jgi:predicted enzyme related to lactoylglutathione lyase